MFDVIFGAASTFAAVAAVLVSLRIHHDEGRPSLVLYLVQIRDQRTVELVLANVGKGVARNIYIENFKEDFVEASLRSIIKECFVFKGISCLAPGVELRTVIAAGADGVKECELRECDVKVVYEEDGFILGRRTVKYPFHLRYKDCLNSIYTVSDFHYIRRDIEGVRKAIEKLANAEVRIAKSIESQE